MTFNLYKKIIKFLEIDNDKLFNFADTIRQKYVGNEVHLRALIEFSNYCKNSCKYCGLRKENKNLKRYRMMPEEIISHAKLAKTLKYKTVVLQSGEDEYYNKNIICHIIQEIKKLDLAITLSIGERTFEDFKDFKLAGADRYLLRIETTDKNLYKELHPNMNYENRIKCLENLKNLGFELGTGIIVGLPNQSIQSLANDILFFKDIDADMIGIGPFISHPNTPLNINKNGDFFLALKVMAITRILLKNINIPATTAMETINKNGRVIALKSGANVIMPNITNLKYRKYYEIYPGKICINEDAIHCNNCIKQKILQINRTISENKGYSKKFLSKYQK